MTAVIARAGGSTVSVDGKPPVGSGGVRRLAKVGSDAMNEISRGRWMVIGQPATLGSVDQVATMIGIGRVARSVIGRADPPTANAGTGLTLVGTGLVDATHEIGAPRTPTAGAGRPIGSARATGTGAATGCGRVPATSAATGPATGIA